MGFSQIKKDYGDQWRRALEPVVMEVEGFEFAPSRAYAIGRRLPNGEEIRVTMSHRGASALRVGLEQRSEAVLPGGVMLFHDCSRNGNGTYEASRSVVLSRGPGEGLETAVIHGVWARVCPPMQREDGRWSQAVQYVDAARSMLVSGYDHMVETVLQALGESGPGRPGAVVRGMDAEGVAMAAQISAAWDAGSMTYKSPEESFDDFIDREMVRIDGINVSVPGADFLGIVQKFSDARWEVMPMRTLGLGSFTASAAAEGGRDLSRPYRVTKDLPRTGFAPSIVCACKGEGWFAKDAVPLSGIPRPLLLAHLPTESVRPQVDYVGREEPQPLPRPSYLARGKEAEDFAAKPKAKTRRSGGAKRTKKAAASSKAVSQAAGFAEVGGTPLGADDADFELHDADLEFLNSLGSEEPDAAVPAPTL